uniref:Uncharacterized protein n=1 Tax=Arundo donax TaxID=35708 RepID=A0A0A9FTH1_ARUDO
MVVVQFMFLQINFGHTQRFICA